MHSWYAKWGGAMLGLGMLFIAIIPGCASKKSQEEDPFFGKWKIMAGRSNPASPAKKIRAIELPPENGRPAPKKQPQQGIKKSFPTQKVTLKMYNTEVAVLLRALARAADQNIMINTTVEGKININVKDAPWDQVFKAILRTRGLTYTWEGDIIRIMTAEDMEHDLRIDSIIGKRKAQKIGLKNIEPLLTKIILVDYADAKGLKKNLDKFLTKDEEGNPRGSVLVDEHNNALIIQAIRDDLERMIPLIQSLDRATPQVLIEANIVETTRDTARELGIQWGGLYHSGNYWVTPGANTDGVLGQTLNQGINPSTGQAVNFPADLGSEVDPAGLTVGLVTEELGKYLLNVQLSALENEGRLNILSSPSITTVDNQKAIIESGSEVPFQSIDENGNIKVEFKKAVLRLEVIPHVINGKMLKLKIITHKDEVDFTSTVLGNPTIITKNAETNLILYDDQTTVIGGLSKQSTSDSESGIPGLKEIPLLGYLFKGEGKTDKMEEVLIFITPHILKEKQEVPSTKS